MENILSTGKKEKLTPKQITQMQEDLKNGFPNSMPLIDPTGEYIRQFQIKIGIELWGKAINHFFS
ncbi:MAG TPA: hypothetical protein VIJ75_12515 [Hanamia sp.]